MSECDLYANSKLHKYLYVSFITAKQSLIEKDICNTSWIFYCEILLHLFNIMPECPHYCTRCISRAQGESDNILTGEASASTMWDNQAWSYLHGGVEETEPPFLAQDFIHIASPSAKIIIMLRDPVERYCSRNLYPLKFISKFHLA